MKQPHKIKFEIFGIQKQVTIEAETYQDALQIMIASLADKIVILPEDAKQEPKEIKTPKKDGFFTRLMDRIVFNKSEQKLIEKLKIASKS